MEENTVVKYELWSWPQNLTMVGFSYEHDFSTKPIPNS